ncbi:ATP-binding protein [Streptomyces sp. NPDC020141]|uniref:ATP-binding protein n=1 Tax=Streptomyces sp. NPDC020141 TaxID=3365065 RepID=UPI0037B0E115
MNPGQRLRATAEPDLGAPPPPWGERSWGGTPPDEVLQDDGSARLVLPGLPESVGTARSYTRAFVADWMPGVTGEQLDDLRLIVSELVTNAVRYGTEPGDSLLVVLAVRDRTVRVEVHDPVRRVPRVRGESVERERGRGLRILGVLARWGIEERPLGKVVWAEPRW